MADFKYSVCKCRKPGYFRLERVTALDGPASECGEMKFLWTCSLQAGMIG